MNDSPELGFGEDEEQQSEEFQRRQENAKDLGFTSEAQLERARRFSELPEAEFEIFTSLSLERSRSTSASRPRISVSSF